MRTPRNLVNRPRALLLSLLAILIVVTTLVLLSNLDNHSLSGNNNAVNQQVTGQEDFVTAGDEQVILVPPLLTPDMSTGVDVIPDYVDDEVLVFHGYFGLFIYDLKEEKIIFAADLEKAVGTTNIQGDNGAAVRVSADGKTVQLYSYSINGESDMAYFIDTHTGEYTYEENSPVFPAYSLPAGMYDLFSGVTLGELTCNYGNKSRLIFANWNWAD